MTEQEMTDKWTVDPNKLKRDYDELQEKHEAFKNLMADHFIKTNRGMMKLQVERDEARAEVAQLRAERDLAQQLGRDEATVNQQMTVRPEPSRLEIAAILLQGVLANPSTEGSLIHHYRVLDQADALIAAAKEVTK